MTPRIDILRATHSKAIQPMLALQGYVNQSVDSKLLHLVQMRASQINGCAYCIDMHTKDARAEGESEQRLFALDAWRETPFFSDHERAALEWTEAVTLVREGHVSDQVFERVRRHFEEGDLIHLTLAVLAINSWNRLCIAFRPVVGEYRPRAAA
jgi:AhpD family alkylhydroperoxidase